MSTSAASGIVGLAVGSMAVDTLASVDCPSVTGLASLVAAVSAVDALSMAGSLGCADVTVETAVAIALATREARTHFLINQIIAFSLPTGYSKRLKLRMESFVNLDNTLVSRR